MQLRFLSRNEHKIAEAGAILQGANVQIIPITLAITELQSASMETIVRDKALKAYAQLGHPLFVEQTGLYLDQLEGLPGGLTQVFWDGLKADRFCELFGQSNTGVTARTRVGYCDGRRIFQFQGEIRGRIVKEPRGSREFQWDCVFLPDGYDKTFAELGSKKNDISMRRRALDLFKTFLLAGSNA